MLSLVVVLFLWYGDNGGLKIVPPLMVLVVVVLLVGLLIYMFSCLLIVGVFASASIWLFGVKHPEPLLSLIVLANG